jgi:hypothetical protein
MRRQVGRESLSELGRVESKRSVTGCHGYPDMTTAASSCFLKRTLVTEFELRCSAASPLCQALGRSASHCHFISALVSNSWASTLRFPPSIVLQLVDVVSDRQRRSSYVVEACVNGSDIFRCHSSPPPTTRV